MIVRESLYEFERGGDPKNVLGIGKKYVIEEWLKNMGILETEYTINYDLTIDVKSKYWRGVDLSNKGLTELPDYIQFNKVDGNFYISHNELTTLRGCPRIVNFFGFDNNNLSNFEYLPEKYDNLSFAGNPISSLKGLERFPAGTVYPMIMTTTLDPLKLVVDAINAGYKLGKTSSNIILSRIKDMDSVYVNSNFNKYKILNDILNPFNKKFYKDRTEDEIDKNIEEAIIMLKKAKLLYVSSSRMIKNKTIMVEKYYKNSFDRQNYNYSIQWGIYKSNAIRQMGKSSDLFEHPFYTYTDFAKWLIDYINKIK